MGVTTRTVTEMPSEYAIRDISNQIEALLTATPAPEVRAEQEERQEAVAWSLRLPDGRTTLEKAYPKWAEGGDGYAIQPLYTTPQPGQDVRALVKECLDDERECWTGDSRQAVHLALDDAYARVLIALAAHRQAQQRD